MTRQEWINAIIQAELNCKASEKYPGRWDVEGNVDLRYKKLTKLPLQFGVVSGDFACYNNQLETLEGAPQSVGGSFYCFNNKLKSLEGAPKEVGGDFECHSNKLKSLEGLPKCIDGGLFFNDNPLEHLNDLNNVQIKGIICITDDSNITTIKALQNTNLDTLEYTLHNHKYWFENDSTKKDFFMYIEQLIIKKRLEKDYLLELI